NPFFSTDSAAALRASELGADCLLKATQVDGVYSADPKDDPKAQRFTRLSFKEVIERDLKVMDTAAVVLCNENGTPIDACDLHRKVTLGRGMRGEPIGTIIDDGAPPPKAGARR